MLLFLSFAFLFFDFMILSSLLTVATLHLLYSFTSSWDDGLSLLNACDPSRQMVWQDTCVLPDLSGLGTKAD